MQANERTSLLSGIACASVGDEDLAALPVYYTIHQIAQDIVDNVDVSLSTEQLHSPEIAFAIIQPLEAAYAELNDPSIVYCLLLNRLHFIHERDSALASSSLNESRAQLCEILAIKLLRHQAVNAASSAQGLLAMSRSMVGGFNAFQGAGESVLNRIREKEGFASRVLEQGAGKTNALELAILSKARGFIKSQATQRVITAIWEGKIVYSASSFLDILPDRFKIQQIKLYKIKNAPILDHYRMRVPKYRAIIDFFSFAILFASFLVVVSARNRTHSHRPVSSLSYNEIWFFIYTLGYGLDRMSSILEHGWKVFSAGLTNGLDALCLPIFGVAFILRTHSVLTNDQQSSDEAFAILSCAACLMFPRFAFGTISSNVLILSLRAMLADFAWLMSIAVFCFGGFVFSLQHLCNGEFSTAKIGEWLVFIWFGLDGKGIDMSQQFHPLLGPILFLSFAALSNTLLVSLLVAILTGTYANIASDAAAEDMFRKAVLTFEGVKCDSLFDYFPPLNLVALCIMWPISKVTSPRWFHKINVATTRSLSLPILLLIALYERQSTQDAPIRIYFGSMRARMIASFPTKWSQRLSLLEGAHWECEAVFEYTPNGEKDEEDEDDDRDATDEAEASLDSASISALESVNNAIGYSGIRTPQQRAVSRNRASIILSTPPSQSAPFGVPPPSAPPTRPPSPVVSPSKPTPIVNRDRLPNNAGSRSSGQSPQKATGSLPSHFESALSTSPAQLHAHFPSPLARLYNVADVGSEAAVGTGIAGIAATGGLRRRQSLGIGSGNRPLQGESAVQQGSSLEKRLEALVARLEQRLDKSE